jgi:hypothetical protein
MKNFKFAPSGMLFSLIAGLLFMSSAVTMAQKANFAGSWTLNEAKSPMPENGFRMGATKMTATQDDQKLTIERTFQGQNGEDIVSKEVFTLDGKECENTFFQSMKRKSTLAWSADGKVLTINSVTNFERDGETMEMKSSEVMKLSDDGTQLQMDTRFSTPNGDMKSTIVYDKAK